MIDYLVSVATIVVIGGILALGLNVRWGWSGDLDLAYYAYVAIGAYIGAVIQAPPSHQPPGSGWILGLSLPFPLGILGGVAATIVVSAIVGSIALRRLRGDYFAITTVAFALVAAAVLSQDYQIFNGFNGVYGVPQPFEAQLNLNQSDYGWLFLGICVLALVIVYAVLNLLYRSPFGMTLLALREDESAAAAFGRNPYSEKLKAYVVGGVCAGLGGVLFADYLSTWNPSAWAPAETFLLYSAIFIGGQGNQRGVLLGTLLAVGIIPEATRYIPQIPGHADLAPALHMIIVGVLLIGVLKFRPKGVIPERRPKDRGREVGTVVAHGDG